MLAVFHKVAEEILDMVDCRALDHSRTKDLLEALRQKDSHIAEM
jgi:hypothetical protein